MKSDAVYRLMEAKERWDALCAWFAIPAVLAACATVVTMVLAPGDSYLVPLCASIPLAGVYALAAWRAWSCDHHLDKLVELFLKGWK